MRFSRATSNMELGREGKGIQNLFTISQGQFLFYKRDWGRYVVTRALPDKLKKLARQRRRNLDPTLLHGSTINPVTDILGFRAALRWYISSRRPSQSFFVMYFVFPRGAPEAGKESRSRFVL